MRLGVPATIFVPTISSPAKIERIRDYGADLVVGGERYADALAASEAWAAQSPARCRCTPSTRPRRCSARARSGWSSSEQAPRLDTLLVAVGGGGLIGGIAAWYGGRVRVIGVEPEAAPTLTRALRGGPAGRRARRAASRPIRWRASGRRSPFASLTVMERHDGQYIGTCRLRDRPFVVAFDVVLAELHEAVA